MDDIMQWHDVKKWWVDLLNLWWHHHRHHDMRWLSAEGISTLSKGRQRHQFILVSCLLHVYFLRVIDIVSDCYLPCLLCLLILSCRSLPWIIVSLIIHLLSEVDSVRSWLYTPSHYLFLPGIIEISMMPKTCLGEKVICHLWGRTHSFTSTEGAHWGALLHAGIIQPIASWVSVSFSQ